MRCLLRTKSVLNIVSLLVTLVIVLSAGLITGCGGGSEKGASGGGVAGKGTSDGGGSTVPAAPTGLVARAVSNSEIAITWTDNSSNEDGFRIESSSGGSGYTEIAVVSAGITTYDVTGLFSGVAYSYRVCAYNNAGKSDYSGSAEAVTLSLSEREQVLELITGHSYYLDVVQGNDETGDGSSASPWQTLKKAQSIAVGGDGVFLRNGNYGAYIENTTGRSAWVVYINDEGHAPVITNVRSRFNTSRDVYLLLYGIKIAPAWVDPAGDAAWQADHPGSTDPQYPDSASGTYVKTAQGVDAMFSNYLRFINCEIVGANKHLTIYGFYVHHCHNLMVKNCHIHRVSRGINFQSSSLVRILYNHINNITSTFIQPGFNCSDVLIEGNNAYDSNWSPTEDWCPRAAGHTYHASFISIRSGDITIRNNIFHDGGTSATIMLYTQQAECPDVYNNIIIENNLLYDPQTQGGLRLSRVGENVVIRNNILVGRQRYDAQPGPQQYGTVFNLEGVADGYDGSGLSVYNNIFIGMAGFGRWFNNIQEGGNIYWSALTTPAPDYNWVFLNQAALTKGSKVITWQNGVAPDYFTNGFFNGELDFSWVSEGGVPHGHGKVIDYTYAPGSEAINFGNVTHQSAESLGTIDAAGFILEDGRTRNGSHHSTGCYEP